VARFARLQAPVTNVDDAGIDRDTFDQMMIALDKDGDGHVTKDEFKIPWMKLFPKLKDADFEKAWLKIDSNADGELSLHELAAHYGFNLSPSANRAGKGGDEEMTDEQILEALQLSATLADMQAEQEERKKAKEAEEQRLKEEAEEALKPKNRRGASNRRASSTGSDGKTGSDGLRRGSTTGLSAMDREKKKTSSGVLTVKMPTKVTGADDDPDITFMQKCELGDQFGLKEALKSKEQVVRMEDDKGEMPIHKLARHGCVDIVREILDRCAKVDAVKTDLNWQDKQGKTAIFYAVEYGQTALVHIFLDRGADVMVENNNGWTVLHTAVNADQLECCQAILEHPRVVPQKQRLLDACDRSKRQALHIASFKSREGEVVELLLKHGADASAQDATGNTGAKLAAKTGRRKSKELLEEHLNAANEASARPVEVKA